MQIKGYKAFNAGILPLDEGYLFVSRSRGDSFLDSLWKKYFLKRNIKGLIIGELDKNFKETNAPIVVGAIVKLKKNDQVGEVLELKGKRAIVKVGQLPMNIDLVDLLVVEEIAKQTITKTNTAPNTTKVFNPSKIKNK